MGIIFALTAAFLQSCCYLISGAYVRRSSLEGWTLTAPQQITMLPFSIFLVVFFFPGISHLDWKNLMMWNLLCMISGYAGNFFLFQMQKYVEPSRTAPLQALKIPMIVVLSSLLFSKGYSIQQIFGVALIIASSVLMSGAGSVLNSKAWILLLLCVFSFAVCDIAIVKMLEINSRAFDMKLDGVLFTLGIGLFSTGILALPAIFFQRMVYSKVPEFSLWVRYALPYSLLWIVALGFLFTSFSISSVELGTMVQSSRSLISVVMGYMLSHTSAFGDVETSTSKIAFVKRMVAAILIISAIVFYNF